MNTQDYKIAKDWSGEHASPIKPTPRPNVTFESPQMNIMPVVGIIVACGVLLGACLGIAGV